jgi:hypothetical protein
MREIRTSGSVGAPGRQRPGATRQRCAFFTSPQVRRRTDFFIFFIRTRARGGPRKLRRFVPGPVCRYRAPRAPLPPKSPGPGLGVHRLVRRRRGSESELKWPRFRPWHRVGGTSRVEPTTKDGRPGRQPEPSKHGDPLHFARGAPATKFSASSVRLRGTAGWYRRGLWSAGGARGGSRSADLAIVGRSIAAMSVGPKEGGRPTPGIRPAKRAARTIAPICRLSEPGK